MSKVVCVISKEEPKSMPEGYTLGKWVQSDLAVVSGALTGKAIQQINNAETGGLKVMFYLKDRTTHEALALALCDHLINFDCYIFSDNYMYLGDDINTVQDIVSKR